MQVAVGLLQQRTDTRYQRRRLRRTAFAIGHQLGLHAAVVGRAARAECGHRAAGVGGPHAQRVFRHFELSCDIGEIGQALVQPGGAGLNARIARRENVNQQGELLALLVIFLRLNAVIILDGHAVGMVLHRYPGLGQLLAIVGQEVSEVRGGEAHSTGHAPAERVRIASPADECGHGRGMV